MSAIKFSKQTIHPNPKEVDYWVDISKNPYGNVIKYFNGQDWVDLAYTGGLPDLSSYYTKVQVNELLNKKADAVEVDKLVSDEEIANVINNISFTTSNPNSVDLVKFNFDGTKVAVTLPIASNTTAGIVSSDDFKDFVKQWQLQKLYIEMYDLFADIRAKYQRKLKAGLNIHIDEETDTISAASDLSVMWDNLLGKPDFDQLFTDVYTTIDEEEDRAKAEEERLGQRITDHVDVVKAELDLKADKKDMYTKDQVDQKVSSVYRVIGSSTFEELPTEGNTIGDVYNITNDFTLNGIEYPFGTNLVWTADGWDTLSGVFDTTELEGMVEAVDTKVDEEILRAKAAELNIQTQLDAEIKRAKESEESIETAYKTADTTLYNNIDAVDGKLVNYLPLNDNAVSATKLETPRTIWGQSFDGSGDITGQIQATQGIVSKDTISIVKTDNTSSKFQAENNIGTVALLAGNPSRGIYDVTNSQWLFGFNGVNSFLQGGNIGIGTTDPQYKLDVKGSVRTTYTRFTNNSGTNVGYVGAASGGEDIFLTSNTSSPIFIYNNNDTLSGITINSNGHVGIGTTKASCKLDVKGNVSGDFVDWYGVEWTDSQSDPPLIRIGNMSYHRSLPIQSGMKGYAIMQAVTTNGEMILPLTDDWSKAKFATGDNGTTGIGDFTNTVVKIPEYWYIHEYDETTGTHQLKLSQTAKAGWLHHKEAYVGAYEGYNDGTYYRSVKGQVPTVSVTRETIRGLARANGYEDEYKWNIYTYEEHKAICHLFMVEYATRNSQAAVNTELTADGFKQGGLGSGCTSGSVTIGGETKYSFIPTGVTDSLGNGSGQVAYTVTQTDADGNETGTVTRYANRYRGIENPFGHIWKHCDDVISKYDSTAAYRTFYKCNKPEHFATNKNTKYKPVCSAPVAEGYKKTLKHTIGLDLFAYEVGRSASTYWCDYNYDNTDTAEHCLLIGSSSYYGAAAGLFCLASDGGVGHSHVHIGSRLTYLPWAE